MHYICDPILESPFLLPCFGLTDEVTSTTVMGDRNHPREKVKANVVRANIPVANGVVHLIDKPLIIVASPLWDYLQEEVSKLQKQLSLH